MIKEKIEAILFFTGQALSIDELSDFFSCNPENIREVIEDLKIKYSGSSGILLNEYDNKYIFQTNPKYYTDLTNFFDINSKKNLTKAALEVLSIIAYKQPVTKAEIDEIRGVKSDNIIKRLENEEFIYVSDTLDAPGRPNLYNTTNTFLRRFNIDNLDELPEVEVENT